MKKETTLGWLPVLNAVAVAGVFVVLTVFMQHSRSVAYQEGVAATHQRNVIAFQNILGETVQYAQRNPGIEPVLASIGVQRNETVPANRR